MILEILQANNPESYKRWLNIWKSWEKLDIFAHPDYLKLYEYDGSIATVAVAYEDNCGILYPFLLYPLHKLPFVPSKFPKSYDIKTPYGYGGPFWWGQSKQCLSLLDKFWSFFESWAHENNIVCEFIRFSLFDEIIAPYPGNTEERSLNIVRSLNMKEEDIWMDYKHKVRKNVKKAIRSGVDIEIDEKGKRLNAFLNIYKSTMYRRSADAFYHFPQSYFKNLNKYLKNHIIFFYALIADKIISTELALISSETMYSFLGGTLEEYYEFRPNDLLKHQMIQWGCRKGLKYFVLGGGYKPDDGIYKYKLSFSPNGIRKFIVGKRIFKKELYGKLIELKKEYMELQGLKWNPDPRFFPKYRA